MRQSNHHQKNRSRGRGRKPQNPLSRNFESNGPDVKIRGNAGHIAEKYSTLARDALSNGDTVMAENYFQHAEHYNRIVAAAQAQRAEEQAAIAARNPQPESEDTNESNANGQAEEQAVANEDAPAEQSEATEAKPQKNGRGRRTRKAPVAKVDDAEATAEDENIAPEASVVEAISDDASKLPESITGGMMAEDS